jgi:hypothetical protein
MERDGNNNIGRREQRRALQIFPVISSKGNPDLLFTPVLQLVYQPLYLAILIEEIHGRCRMDIYPPPEHLQYRVCCVQMKIGPWKMIVAIGTNAVLALEQVFTAGIAYLGEDK